MWRLLRNRPAARPWATRAVAKHVHGSEEINIQRIKIAKRTTGTGTRTGNILVTAGVAFVCFTVYSSVVLSPWSRFVQKTIDELDEKEKEELKGPAFIPVPLTIKEVQSEPYRGTDPEWAAFIRVSKDATLQKKIRGDLADIVRKVVEVNPLLVQRGGNVWKIRRFWVDVDYPYRPPPKYLRSGFEFRDDGRIVWTSKEMDPNTARKIQQTLWPSPVAISMFNFAGVLFKQNFWDAAKAVGYQPNEPSQQTHAGFQAMRKVAEKLQGGSTKDPAGVKDPTTAAKQQMPGAGGSGTRESDDAANSATVSPPPVKDPFAQQTSSTPPPPAKGSPDMNKLPQAKDLVPYDQVRGNIDGAWTAFRRTLSQKMRPMRHLPASGCILVSGLVELEAPKAYIVIDVQAWYDPKTNSYDGKTMFMGLRRLQYKQQSPQR